MADVFQKFKSTVNRGITTISVKTSSSLEKTKIKTHIDTLNREIERELLAVGEAAYDIWSNGGTDFSSLSSSFETVKGKQNEIADLNKEIEAIDERDNQILGSSSAPEAPEAPRIICSGCGTQYDAPVKFCRKCGNKMAE